jgi:glucosamine--fructose-6-phosphate aminotransferase (isomerizing)
MRKLKILVLSFLFFHNQTNYSCSIFAYIGSLLCKAHVLKGLSRLEYRGYDSAGFACFDVASNGLVMCKKPGKLQELKNFVIDMPCDGYVGLGHTRWATHGEANETNAHPHMSADQKFVVVHNGIIENFFQLKKELIDEGYEFISQTDSEVIAHLFDRAYKKNADIKVAALEAVNQLHGACTFVGLHQDHPEVLIVARQRSPLCIGISQDGMHVASDFLAFADKTNEVYFMPEKSIALVKKDMITAFDYTGEALSIETKIISLQPSAYEKLDHEHFMLKEIYEQREAIKKTIAHYKSLGDGLWETLGLTEDKARSVTSINLFGCGTSWHAARIGQFFFEKVAKLPVSVHLASEFRYMEYFPSINSLFIAISQSGETADTLELIRYFNSYGAHTIALTNVETSSMVRETSGNLLTKAGPEIAVASTKAFATQLASLYWLAHRFALVRGWITVEQMAQAETDLLYAADVLEQTIDAYKVDIIAAAKTYAQSERVMYLGRHVTYPFAMEAALKLKEISYIFAQGYPAGELKHGSIALVDEQTPIVLFSHQDPVIYQKLVGNAQEVKARKGHTVIFAFEGQDELIALAHKVFVIPRVAPLLEPLAMTGIMQFFAYQVALALGRDIDKPRNLAKAVTVE